MKTYFFIFFAVLLISYSCDKDEDTNIVCDECSGKGSENIYMLVNGEIPFGDDTQTIQLLVKFGDIEVSTDYNPYSSYNNQGYDSYNSTSTSYENIDEEWSEFNSEICGFDFEAGYEYELNINRIKEDGSDIYKYCLNGIISTKQISL